MICILIQAHSVSGAIERSFAGKLRLNKKQCTQVRHIGLNRYTNGPLNDSLRNRDFDEASLDFPVLRRADEVTLLLCLVVVRTTDRTTLVRDENRLANFPFREGVPMAVEHLRNVELSKW